MFKNSEADILEEELAHYIQGGQVSSDAKAFEPELEIARMLTSLPRANVPVPTKRRLYLQTAPQKGFWANYFSNMRMLMLTTGGLFLLALIVLGGFAIGSSGPGQSLYTYKKVAERIRINLATSPEHKVNLELALTEKRLAEARKTIAANPNNPELTATALKELTDQTEQTIAKVEQAVQNETPAMSSEIAQKLEALAKEQLALIDSIPPTPETEPETQRVLAATQETSKQAETIKKIMATTSEGTIAEQTEPTIITGLITAVTEKNVSIDNVAVTLTQNTIIASGDKILDRAALKLKLKVTVTAIKEGEALIAQKIVIEIAPLTKESAKQPESAQTEDPGDAPPEQQKPQATFIPEDPNPQPAP